MFAHGAAGSSVPRSAWPRERPETQAPRMREEGEELDPGEGAGAEARQVRRQHLRVDPSETAVVQPIREVEEEKLRGVRLAVEHALGGERAVDVDPVQPRDQAI